MWYTRLEINSHAHFSLGELDMSQPRIMTVPNDETLVAFGTMNGIAYAIARTNNSNLYGAFIWGWMPFNGKKVYQWRLCITDDTLDDALYYLDNVTGRLAILNLY
jgi:hypothetical protein